MKLLKSYVMFEGYCLKLC